MIKSFKKINRKSGFTLVELLVTIVIFVILTGVVLVNSNSFDNSVLLNNLGYDVALTIKQAQSFGVNVKEDNSGVFSSSYGVYFNTDTGDSGSLTNFVLFSDINGDKVYFEKDVSVCPTGADEDLECIQKYSMRNGTRITSICAVDKDSINNECVEKAALSVIFTRPSLEAKIYGDEPNSSKNPAQYAKITLSSSNNSTTSVVVTSAGQVYVKK